MGFCVRPKFISIAFTGPFAESRFLIANNEINCGMAMVMMNTVRKNTFPLIPLRLMSTARKIPPK
ncbi:unknown [Corallococcus sp. CAG:1435]|nr:unknown [Corallococcus sp. CAG:1435]